MTTLFISCLFNAITSTFSLFSFYSSLRYTVNEALTILDECQEENITER